MNGIPSWLPWFLQCGDTQFPSGSYAHSYGLEGLVQIGVVKSAGDLRENLHQQVLPALLRFEVPMLGRAHDHAAAGDVAGLVALDWELDAWRLAAETREASRRVGARRLDLCAKLDSCGFIREFAAAASPKHLIAVAGLEHRAAPAKAAALSLVWQTLHAACSAALKLIRMGQEMSHTLLREAMLAAAPRIGEALQLPPEKTGWFDPLTEIASLRHARAGERLFIS